MIAIACGSVLSLFLLAVITLRAKTSGAPPPQPGTNIFLLSARYRPMLRLLDGSDFEMLSEAGDPKLLRRMRAQRRLIFRSYLRGLRRDHLMLCDQVRQVIVNSDFDRKDLALRLMRTQTRFQVLTALIEMRLVLHAAGFGSVTAAPLVNAFERVSDHARSVSEQFTGSLAA